LGEQWKAAMKSNRFIASSTAAFCLGLTLWHAGLQGQGPAGRVEGKIVTEDGQPVKGAYLVASQRPGSQGPVARKKGAASGADGSFSVQDVPPGIYTLCTQASDKELLDPCRWSAAPPSVTVGAGQTVTGLEIRLKQGVTLRVSITDPSKHLAAHEGKTAGAHLLVGVFTADGVFHAAPKVTGGAAARVYSLVVPADTPLELSVYSKFFQLSDEKGTAVASAGGTVPFQAPARGQLRPFQFTVTGIGAP
jgi:hypothetical protein